MDFGVISTADIGTEDVIPGIQQSDHTVAAIGSRDEQAARTVADDLGIERAYGSYEALLADDGIDAVYNPLPNALHAEWTKRAADHGLHVLCEKPLAVDEAEAAELFEYCDDAGVTLMEAFMYRYHPRTVRAREIVDSELGEVRAATASFTFNMRWPGHEDDFRLDPDLAGGSLMDVGCYAVSAIRGFLGEPERVHAVAADTRDSGVDSQLTGVLEYEDGVSGRVHCGFDTPNVERYRVETVDGWLEARRAFGPKPDESVSLTWSVDGREVTETFDPVDHYTLETEGFAEAIEAGEAPLVDREDSLGNARVLDALMASAERGEPVSPS
ncbi:glucose-fructose oxidoreductase [Salinarchaeum sp. Harcht-Bsk1]|uniref:Gfo/Idh/MocA family protein n=1 Tax=Salinarchaeum sp. Harcht-Bsk1 TaxID=1333523 RepID=UPI00034242BC|nr:Gfo/Idh/MocA family oxidoreductase [Salinarchaeum sp. Harcht-Bsk1]AGN01893.1 glucose-fructose oxidoreductase [Salinarchaeum sp. Harcht-Bsk1]